MNRLETTLERSVLSARQMPKAGLFFGSGPSVWGWWYALHVYEGMIAPRKGLCRGLFSQQSRMEDVETAAEVVLYKTRATTMNEMSVDCAHRRH